ncbi:uncharacterized protein LOC123316723 [Coccinella septempunctata]|uniref:uncharacterized protein LOC123316723 n=1 Tax=Coccinella septempunctata TaxID=41139 RepID=UPI001D095638|nr:uncharacterized protein LOC123316723 [Coccinella septempunctata]
MGLKKGRKEETIKYYKLRAKEVADQFRYEVDKKLVEKLTEDEDERSLEELWQAFKEALIQSAIKVCGTRKIAWYRRQTNWWSASINNIEVKKKKKIWKTCLQARNATIMEYRAQRKKVKELIQEAKRKSSKKLGNRLELHSRKNQKLFYSAMESMKGGEATALSSNIKDEKGNIIRDEGEALQR